MISYELAKKLKETGFPQKGRILINKNNEVFDWMELKIGIICPTLSELIEACGIEFASLNYLSAPRWLAFRKSSILAGRNVPALGMEGFEGQSPEEAVANLWLALNKKV